MTLRALTCAALLLGAAAPASAQSRAVASASGAFLRSLDKVNGRVEDIEVPVGGVARTQGLMISVDDCRYPADNPTGEAYAYLRIRGPQDGVDYFQGWMVASSPALNALDHNRYDVWVLRCKTS